MPGTRIKICGVRDPAAAAAAVEAGAHAIGLVFVPHSPRVVSLAEARRIVAALPPFVEPVGLFVDSPTSHIREVAHVIGLSVVQLHGQETPEQVNELSPLRVIKGLPFDAPRASVTLAPWRTRPANLSAILWDAPANPTPSGPPLTGGSGHALDWQALAAMGARGELRDLRPMILAGGLTPRNVGQAIGLLRPYAVDVSSGVEESRGVKSAALIASFCAAVRDADIQA